MQLLAPGLSGSSRHFRGPAWQKLPEQGKPEDTGMRYFEDFRVGESWPIEARYEMKREEIIAFASRWDPQPFHVDEAAARQSVHGVLTACGTHIQAVVLWLAARLPHETAVIAALGYDEVRFHKPARVHDTLSLTIECLETIPSSSRPRGVVKNLHKLCNQDEETVFTQMTTLLVKSRDG